MQIDIVELAKRWDSGLLSCNKHPSHDIYIWNYTPKCQYERAWDEYTLMCRGLITDEYGNVFARPFKKFFNLNETEETKIENLPNQIPLITSKEDGSLGIVFMYNGERIVATRGSFKSDQAEWATNWLNDKLGNGIQILDTNVTYLFEVIYPENRIVVDYNGKEELILLTMIDNETGNDLDYMYVVCEAERIGVSCVRMINETVDDIVKYLDIMSGNEEGFVALYNNGLRVKFKGKEYLRIHRLITGFSSKSIWKCLMNGEDIEKILYAVPDEFYNFVETIKSTLINGHKDLILKAQNAYNNVKDLTERKSQALIILKDYKDISGLVFTLLNNNGNIASINNSVWKRIEPKYELPFKKNEEL